MHLQPDSLLQNRYRIVGLIAQGGMGAVYQAVDTRLGNTVAFKQTLMADPQLRMAFEGEARLLAALHHPALAVVVPGWTVQVAEVLRGRSAWNALYAANNQNDPVPEGFEYYLVKLRVEPTFSGEAAMQMLLEANQFNDPPGKGMEYVLVRVRARYIGVASADEAVMIDSLDFKALPAGSSDPKADLIVAPSAVEPEPVIDAYLFLGGVSEGWATIEVPKGQLGVRLIFAPGFGFNDLDIRYFTLE